MRIADEGKEQILVETIKETKALFLEKKKEKKKQKIKLNLSWKW
jgi:hypothetical protein